MFTIGEFSKMTALSVKALRFYHERGVLIPAKVDAESGYRSYDQQNLATAQVIVALRELEFSLDEIHEILGECQQDEDVLTYLEKRKREVQESLRSQENILAKLDRVIEQERQARDAQTSAHAGVEQKTLEAVLIGGIRTKGRYDEMGKLFGRLGRALGWHICGKAMGLYYDDEYREDDADYEACFPIGKRLELADVSVRELPAVRVVCLQHVGPYDQLHRSYAKIFAYAKERDLSFNSPCREVFMKGPGMIFRGNPKKYITEIQFVIGE